MRRRYIHHSPIEGIELPAKAASRERILTDDELCTVWIAADELDSHFGAIVKLLILTGQRRSEIGGLQAEWCSIPTAPRANSQPAICLPAEITKNGRTHSFPIGPTGESAVLLREDAWLCEPCRVIFGAIGF